MDNFFEISYVMNPTGDVNGVEVAKVYAETKKEAIRKMANKYPDEHIILKDISSEPPYHSIYHDTIK